MGFMKKNVNAILLLLIVLVAASIVGLTSYYQMSFHNLSSDYHQKVGELQKTASELEVSQVQLNETAVELQLKTEREQDLSGKFTQEREEKRIVIDELNDTREQLAETKAVLASTRTELSIVNQTLQVKTEELDEANAKIGIFRGGVNDILSELSSWTSAFNSYYGADTTTAECKAILSGLEGDVEDAKEEAEQLDDI